MSVQPDPHDVRDLARDVAEGGYDADEETLKKALERVRAEKCQADADDREPWDEAEQALLGALSETRRRSV